MPRQSKAKAGASSSWVTLADGLNRPSQWLPTSGTSYYGGLGRGSGVNAGVACGVVVDAGTGRGNGVGRGEGVGFTPSKSALGRTFMSRGGRVGRGCRVMRGRAVGV